MTRQIEIVSGLKQRKSEDSQRTQAGSTITAICQEGSHLTLEYQSFAQNTIEPFTSHKVDAELQRAQAIQSQLTAHTTFR